LTILKRAYLQIVLDGSAADNEAVPGGDAPKVLRLDGLLVLDLMALEAKKSTLLCVVLKVSFYPEINLPLHHFESAELPNTNHKTFRSFVDHFKVLKTSMFLPVLS
jgi:hypothetical protein